MNYGEEIAYWYLRLNGFFPITNFVIHKSQEIEHRSDVDVLAIRQPYVYEEVGGNPDDWDGFLTRQLDFRLTLGVICEVKTGEYELAKVFKPKNVKYAIGRFGLVPSSEIEHVARQLRQMPIKNLHNEIAIGKLLIANYEKRSDANSFIYRSLEQAEEFIEDRVNRYPEEKHAGRMFFRSTLFQHTIERIHRERQKR